MAKESVRANLARQGLPVAVKTPAESFKQCRLFLAARPYCHICARFCQLSPIEQTKRASAYYIDLHL